MNAHSHTWTEPYSPYTIEADALAIDAEQFRLSQLRQEAREILANPAKWPRDWIDAAHCLLDTGDDAADLIWLKEEAAQAERFAELCEAYEMRTGRDWTDSEYLCALDCEMGNPEPRYAAAHLASMAAVDPRERIV